MDSVASCVLPTRLHSDSSLLRFDIFFQQDCKASSGNLPITVRVGVDKLPFHSFHSFDFVVLSAWSCDIVQLFPLIEIDETVAIRVKLLKCSI